MRFSIRDILAVLVGVALVAALIGQHRHHRISIEKRQARIQQAITLLADVPDNRWKSDSNADPASVIRAVNYLLRIERDEALDALEEFLIVFPNRNNLEIIAIKLFPETPYSLSSTIYDVDGLIFGMDNTPGGGLEGGIDDTDRFRKLIRESEFRDKKLTLPDPKQAMKKLFEMTPSHVLRSWAIYNFVEYADGDSDKIFAECRDHKQYENHFRKLKFKTDPQNARYIIEEPTGE